MRYSSKELGPGSERNRHSNLKRVYGLEVRDASVQGLGVQGLGVKDWGVAGRKWVVGADLAMVILWTWNDEMFALKVRSKKKVEVGSANENRTRI
jgi:hypothetical protein